jgi:60 kDa SS-A/Ro ribonucleoprotein
MKFNLKVTDPFRTINHEGAEAFALTPELELYTAVATTSLSDQFYESGNVRLARIQALVAQLAPVNPLFVAQLAVYAREKMYLRSVPLVLAVELAKWCRGNDLVSRLVGRVVQRADEITELLACYQLANGRQVLENQSVLPGKPPKKLNRLGKQLQKGLAVAFNKFDEYQFAKYDRPSEVKLRDALFLVHPKAKDAAQQALFDRIANRSLATAYTWETELSAVGQGQFADAGQKALAKAEKWEELVQGGKLGYMALLRNLRNLLADGLVSDAVVKQACQTLADARQVAKAKQLPFRYLAAYRELQEVAQGQVGQVLAALEAAVLHSVANLRGFDEKTRVVIAADVSGSMQQPISPNSKVQNFDIGLVLAMLLQNRCANVLTGMFGNRWKVIQVPKDNVLANVMEFRRREGEVGYATNGHLVVQGLIDRRYMADKVMLFTDCQLWDTGGQTNAMARAWGEYKAKVAPQAKLYLFDLAGYGRVPLDVRAGDVHLIAGWSDKVFDVLSDIEQGRDALHQVRQIVL